MQGRLFSICGIVLCAAVIACGKKNPPVAPAQNAAASNLPPKASLSEAPEFMRSLSLIYPESELYRVDNRLLQKTNADKNLIRAYYDKNLLVRKYRLVTELDQSDGLLLQYRNEQNTQVVSIDVQKLPYADNFLIRIGESTVDYKVGGNP